MKVRGAMLGVLAAVLVGVLAPAGAQAQGGNCGTTPTYLPAGQQTRCGPYGSFAGAIAYSSDSAGNVTNASVCVDLEYNNPPRWDKATSWVCNSGSTSIGGSGGTWVAGYKMASDFEAHYIIPQYFWN